MALFRHAKEDAGGQNGYAHTTAKRRRKNGTIDDRRKHSNACPLERNHKGALLRCPTRISQLPVIGRPKSDVGLGLST